MSRSAPLSAACFLAILASVLPASAQDPAAFFDTNCGACHTIGGGDQGGPDLKGVTLRRDRQWLCRFVVNPERMVADRDPLAVEMVKHWDGLVMPETADLTPQLADALLQYIERKSSGDNPSAQAASPSLAFTAEDVVRGRALFTGASRTSNGIPACITCHAVGQEGGFPGGGRLGGDLTRMSARLHGARGVANWLDAPPTPVMRALLRQASLTADENHALAAFLDDAQLRAGSPANNRMAILTAAAATGALAVLAVIAIVWRGRFRSVRRPLVEQSLATFGRGGDR